MNHSSSIYPSIYDSTWNCSTPSVLGWGWVRLGQGHIKNIQKKPEISLLWVHADASTCDTDKSTSSSFLPAWRGSSTMHTPIHKTTSVALPPETRRGPLVGYDSAWTTTIEPTSRHLSSNVGHQLARGAISSTFFFANSAGFACFTRSTRAI